MPNHFHLLIKTNEQISGKELSNDFRRFFITYSMAINNQEKRTGSLFQKSFQRKAIETEDQLILTIYYIHLNMVKHGMTQNYCEYEWSSYKNIINDNDLYLNTKLCLKIFEGKRQFIEMHKEAFENKINFLTGKDAISSER